MIARYLKQIYGYVFKYLGNQAEAEDATQEIFIKVWRNLKKFDRDKSFKTWIFSIAKNACIDRLRKKKSLPMSNFENEHGENFFAESLRDKGALPDRLFEMNNFSRLIEKYLAGLSLPYQKIIYFKYVQNLKIRDIAEIIKEPVNTVKSRHRRAIEELHRKISMDRIIGHEHRTAGGPS